MLPFGSFGSRRCRRRRRSGLSRFGRDHEHVELPSSRKQTISLARGSDARLALLLHDHLLVGLRAARFHARCGRRPPPRTGMPVDQRPLAGNRGHRLAAPPCSDRIASVRTAPGFGLKLSAATM